MEISTLVDPKAFLLACSEYQSASASDRKKLSEPEGPSAVDMAHMPSVAKILDGETDRISHKVAYDAMSDGRGVMLTSRVLTDDGETTKFSLAVPKRGQDLGDTLSRNALSLEIRTGFRFPRNSDGGYLKYTEQESVIKAYKIFFRAVGEAHPKGIPCDATPAGKGEVWRGIFREQDALETEIALSAPEDDLDDLLDLG